MKKFLKGKKFLLGLLLSVIGLSGGLFAAHAYASDIDNTPDCDTVAVIKCGAFSRESLLQKYDQNLYGDLQKVYGAFGISRADMASGNIYQGVVWRDGRVTIGNNTLVATNALTAGRWYNPTNDMTYIPGTTRAYKMSTSHFVDQGQTAMIWMKDGQFQFAVIKPCSNPVTAKPVQSVAACDNLQADKISRTEFHFTATAHASGNSEIVGYKFYFGDGNPITTKTNVINHTFAQDGDHTVSVAALVQTFGTTREVTSDKCEVKVTVTPAPIYSCDNLVFSRISRTEYKFTASATAKNGATLEGYKFYFGDGNPITTKSAAINHTFTQVGDHNVHVAALIKVDGNTKEVTSSKCAVVINVSQPASYSCDSLSADKISRTEYKFNGTASAKDGAMITKYSFDFGDGSQPGVVNTSAGSASISHNYTKDGTYTARLTVTIHVDGQDKQVTGDTCVTKVTVTPLPPVYTCDSLTANKIDRDSYAFTANGTAKQGATISKYTFDFGDGKTGVVNTGDTTAKTNHAYDKDGTYTTKVTISFQVNGQTKEVSGPNCTTKVTVAPQPQYSCDSLTGTGITRTNFSFNGQASAQDGAAITSYNFNFGDGTKASVKTDKNQATTTHEYAEAGTYNVVLSVTVNVNGTTKEVTSPKCATTVTVSQPNTPPVYGCDELTATLIGYDGNASNYKYTLTYTAKNGAELKDVDMNFGDSNASQNYTVDQLGNITHEYAAPGTYTTTATLHFTTKNPAATVTDSTCKTVVSIQPCIYTPGIPSGSNQCTPPVCVQPGTPTTNTNTPICETPPTQTPPSLPSTGPEAVVGSLFGSSALGYGLYSYATSRRTLRNSMKKR